MAMNWLAFAGGAAEAGTEFIKEQRKNAVDSAEAQVKQMYTTYVSRKKESEEKIGKLSSNIAYLRGVMPKATEAELFDIAQNPAVMDTVTSGIKAGDFDPNLINISKVAKVSKENDAKTAEQMVRDMYGLKESTAEPTPTEEEGGITGFIRGIGKSDADAAAARLAGVAGVSMGQLRGAQEYTAPDFQSQSALDLEAMEAKRPVDDRINDAINAVEQSKKAMGEVDRNDKAAVEQAGKAHIDAVAKLGRLTASKALASTKDKSESQIQSELISQIQELPKDSQKRTELEAKLNERKRLAAALTGSDADKVTTANKITAFKSAYSAIIMNDLPTGSVIINKETNEVVISSTVKDSIRAAAVLKAQQALIANVVDAEGRVMNESDRMALISIGVTFTADFKPIITPPRKSDDTGTTTPGTNTPAVPPPEARTGEAKPAPAAPAAPQAKKEEPAKPQKPKIPDMRDIDDKITDKDSSAMKEFQLKNWNEAYRQWATLPSPTPEARYGVGRILYEGLGGDSNPEKGLAYIKRAAEEGHPAAIEYLKRIQSGK